MSTEMAQTITYKDGDALDTSEASGPVIIAHICNDKGACGAGFVLAVSAKYRRAELLYRAWSQGRRRPADPVFRLGQTQFAEVSQSPDVIIANMIGQTLGGPAPIRYAALQDCLRRVRTEAQARGATVQMPRIGAGLAGGDWNRIAQLITEELTSHGVAVTVYDLPRQANVPAGARVRIRK
jgi:O-acetyl-ADP-ribose deacetylase (regulator of RNase III)